jgi:hypothetical protein
LTFTRPLTSTNGYTWTTNFGSAQADSNPAWSVVSTASGGSNSCTHLLLNRASGGSATNYGTLLDPNGTCGTWIGGNTYFNGAYMSAPNLPTTCSGHSGQFAAITVGGQAGVLVQCP